MTKGNAAFLGFQNSECARYRLEFACQRQSCFQGLRGFDQGGLGNEVLRVYTHPRGEPFEWERDYIYRGGQLLASVDPNASGTEETYSFHLDHLSTPRQITKGGSQVALHSYYPFGLEATDSTADEFQLKFTGHERDEGGTGSKSELDYMHARHCSPLAGRFMSVDPARSAEPTAPQAWNRYGYVDNNPLQFVDPDGRLKKNPDGSLKVKLGKVVTATHRGRPDIGFVIRQATLFTDRGDAIEASTVLHGGEGVGDIISKQSNEVLVSEASDRNPMCTDCHGVSFANSEFWINNDQVDTILAGDGYSKVSGSAKVGDVVVYREGGGGCSFGHCV